jgi:hypothetical protein
LRWLIGIAAVALIVGACATLKSNETVCPEYRSLRCASGFDCDMDNERGCMVCTCCPADGGCSPTKPEHLPPRP